MSNWRKTPAYSDTPAPRVLVVDVRIARPRKRRPHVLHGVGVVDVLRHPRREIEEIVRAEHLVQIARVAAVVRHLGLSDRERAQVVEVVE